jgi:hypothetical protein
MTYLLFVILILIKNKPEKVNFKQWSTKLVRLTIFMYLDLIASNVSYIRTSYSFTWISSPVGKVGLLY